MHHCFLVSCLAVLAAELPEAFLFAYGLACISYEPDRHAYANATPTLSF